jgi:peptidoglycan/xylan/chitin deacetylase (PgdA/CDA1 family)
MWSVVPEDWVRPGVAVSAQRVLQQTEAGSVIVLHDGACGGQDVAATVAQIIPALLEQGYEFVSIDQFWQCRQPSGYRS